MTARDPQGFTAQQSFEVTVPNRAPEAVETLPPRTLAVGETESVAVSPFFRDPDGDSLTYEAASSDTEVATPGPWRPRSSGRRSAGWRFWRPRTYPTRG